MPCLLSDGVSELRTAMPSVGFNLALRFGSLFASSGGVNQYGLPGDPDDQVDLPLGTRGSCLASISTLGLTAELSQQLD